MDHVKIWIQIITLVVGTGVLFDIRNFNKKYRHHIFSILWWCALCLNLVFLANTFTWYLFVNFFENVALFKTSLYFVLVNPFTSIFYIALVFFLYNLNRTVHDRPLKQWVGYVSAGMILLVMLRTLAGALGGEEAIVFLILDTATGVVMAGLFLCFLAVMSHFIFAGRRLENAELARAFRLFALFYTVGYLAIIFSSMFLHATHGLNHAVICLAFNIYPFYWYRRILPDISSPIARAVSEGDLSALCERHGISARQREIVELLLRGKSNKDIAAALFIAPHTVKNHIYSLYQKLGVKSRFELVNLVLEDSRE